MRLKIYLSTLIALVLGFSLSNQAFAQLKPKTLHDIQLLLQEKESRSPAQKKMDSRLLQAAREKQGKKMAEGVDLEAADVHAEKDGRVKVDITAEVTDELLNKIRAGGGVILFSKEYHSVRALISLSNAENIAAYSEVRFIKPAALARTVGTGVPGQSKKNKVKPQIITTTFKGIRGLPVTRPSLAERRRRIQTAVKKYLQERNEYNPLVMNSGVANSQGDHSHRADDARNRFGYAGQGIKIGVLSDSYNALGGAAADVMNDDLPGSGNPFGNTTPVTVVADYAGGEDEGRAMLQIVHDLAPKAQLFFATAFIGESSFADNIVALQNTYGCDIIIDDVAYSDEPAFQDGIVAQSVNTVTAAGAMYFSSAGNEGSVGLGTTGVWEGDFNDAGSPAFTGGAKTGTIHNFGSTPANGDSIVEASSFVYNLQWSDPFGASTNDYDLFLVSSNGTVKASSTTVQNGTQDPYEEFNPPSFAAGDRLIVFKSAGAAVRAIQLNTNGGVLKVATTGQIHGHTAAADAYSVAATPATGIPFVSTNTVESFSSDGLRRIFYNANGTPVTPGNLLFSTNGGTVRNKPDITAADGVSTTLPPSTGLNPFFGTSAAAPHAGAIAALIKSASPSMTPAQIRTLLTSTALDIQNAGYDNVSGYGILQAYQAMVRVNPTPLPYINVGTITLTEGSYSNGNGTLEPGELGNLIIQLNNTSLVNAPNVTATVTTSTPGVTITQGSSAYGTINASASATNTGTPIRFAVNSSVACGTAITFQIKVTFNGGVGTLGSTVVSAGLGQKSLASISSTLGSTPPSGSGYTATSGQQTGRVTRGGVASACAAAVANPGLTATTGSRQYDAYTFTNTTGTSACYTVTLNSSNGVNLYSVAYNSSGFVPATPNINYVAAAGSSGTIQIYSFTIAAGSAFTVVVHDISVTPASNSPYTLAITYTACAAAPACTPITITTSSIASGATGTPYVQHFSATGGSGAYGYSITNLPAGLSVAGDSLSGTPTQAGTFAVTVTATDLAGCPAVTKNFTLIIAGNAPTSIAATAGTPQSAHPDSTFAFALKATVKDAANAPLSGVNVTFTAPTTGATGTFAGGDTTVTIVTDANGVATAPAFTANSTPGSYTVTAAVNGVSTPAGFSLSNVCPSTIVTSNADDGPGTLRNVIANACPGSTVTFSANVNSIVLTSGEIPILRAITITGPGANLLAVSGNNLSRIFNITADTNTVNISGLTIKDGQPQDGSLTTNSTNGGGGILLFSGALKLTGVVITNNDASLTDYAEGGGLDNEGSGLVTITGCSITNNMAEEDGGGIAQWGSARMTITNSTISGNAITGGDGTLGGGGIFSYYLMTLTNSTVFGNTGYNAGGNIYRYTSTLTMGNTVVGGGVLTSGATTAKDIYGTISSTGYNLIQNTGGYTISGTTTGNQLGVNPKLFPLGNYGGFVPTLLPMSNSPVINAGNTALTAGIDERGNSRYVGGRADIGAVETNYAALATSGTPQATAVNTPFALPLQVKVTESGNLIAGDTVIFTAPSTGASGTFPGTSLTAGVVTNAAGMAASPVFTANNTLGSYADTASIGVAIPTVTYSLTNVFPTSITDYFRTRQNGNWNSITTWESSPDNTTWYAATLTPDFNAKTITVLNTHAVTVTANVTVDQVTVNNGGGVTVSNGDTLIINDGAGFDLTVNGLVMVQPGGNILLKSTVTGSASIGTSSGSITGSVTVDRYIPSRRAWRLMTSPLSNTNTIRQSWQNGGVYSPGIGTFITGPGGSNGLDNGNNYSLKAFDAASQLLLPVTNTNQSLSAATGSADNKGYFMFVRGDRNPANLTTPNTNITTVSSKGSLQMGTQTFEAYGIASNFTLIGNAYASPVDFSLLTRNNVAKRFYAWDPALNIVGGYVLLDDQDGDGIYSITPPSSQTNILQSGQAFFVQTMSAGSASLVFTEASKSSVTSNTGFRTNNGTSEVLSTTLYLKNSDTSIVADAVLAEFNNNYSKDVNMEDGAKMANINENLAIQRNAHSLAIERRPLADVSDTLFLNLTNTTSRNYSFTFAPSNISSVVSAWLEDSYLKTSTPLSVTEPTTVDFSVAAGTASANANRFTVVFKTSSALPLSAINVKASQQNGGIQVNWNIATESNMSNYQVERSANGQNFKKAATTAATGNNSSAVSYNWFDAAPFAGNNFYRIKAVSKTGGISYSQVVIVKTGNGKSEIVIYPNPAKDKTISVQLINEPAGTYIVQLFNSLGQQLLAKTIEHTGGSATQTIQLGSLVSKGVYQLHISNGDNQVNKQVIVP